MSDKAKTWKGNQYILSREEAEARFIGRLNDKYGKQITYIGGYTDSRSSVICKCNRCGSVLSVHANKVRSAIKTIFCAVCNEKKKLIEHIAGQIAGLIRTRIKEETKQAKNKPVVISDCKECGVSFVKNSNNKVYCSRACAVRAYNRRKEKRLYKNGMPDQSITLLKLAIRDGGKCHICGKKVNMKANKNGNCYGSIDHVLPIAEGGPHKWENVRLAHRGCNSRKRASMCYEGKDGQMCLSL